MASSETIQPVHADPTSKMGEELYHILCCQDQRLTMCGFDEGVAVPPPPNVLYCVVCEDLGQAHATDGYCAARGGKCMPKHLWRQS